MGDAEEYRMSEERRDIVNLLRRVGEPLGPKEIAQMLGRNYGAVRVMLSEMVKDGSVASPSRGKYISTNNANNANTTNSANNANNSHAAENVSDVSGATNNQHSEMRRGKPTLLNVSDVSDHGLTPDQSRRVQDLIAEGMAPKFARAEVLGEG
jgi:butyrate kinase